MSIAKIGVLVVILGFLSFVGEGVVSPAYAAEKCKKGETPVEDIGTGKIACEGDDTLDTNTVAQRLLGRPGKPGSPGMSSGSGENCGLKKWGCEEVCQQVYLNQAGGSAMGASQRAKVRLGSCKKTCDEKFACEANAPKSP